jgi:hypothetical protein
MTTAFASMLGGEILTYVRDTVINVAVNKRSFFEQSAAVGGMPLNSRELGELAALDAAAEIIQFAVSAGQDARTAGKPTPEWVLKIAAQARTALVAEKDSEADA